LKCVLTLSWLTLGTTSVMVKSLSGCGYGNGRRRIPFTTEKMTVLALMPIARPSTTTAAKAGAPTIDLRACLILY
jgi:hypothetical protein